MLGYIARRILQMIPLLIGLSIIIFVIIQLLRAISSPAHQPASPGRGRDEGSQINAC